MPNTRWNCRSLRSGLNPLQQEDIFHGHYLAFKMSAQDGDDFAIEDDSGAAVISFVAAAPDSLHRRRSSSRKG
jgi:hypothetical protein